MTAAAPEPATVSVPAPATVSAPAPAKVTVPAKKVMPATVPAGDGSTAPQVPVWLLVLVAATAAGVVASSARLLAIRKE